ncbi:MAG: hypothetical protein JW943_10275 [Deltaproteobacteria bacterium]|nr:hypothetical protein [Deltaproteobacteria bacterium]
MPQSLSGEKIALWFFGKGFRNRVAFELGARAMGADVSFIPGDLGIQEPLEDIGHYLKNWFSMLVIRAKNHDALTSVVSHVEIPVINARTDYNHPCEILGDLQYMPACYSGSGGFRRRNEFSVVLGLRGEGISSSYPKCDYGVSRQAKLGN